MRAIIQARYGDPDAVLSLGEVDKPEPAPDEVRVKVKAASVHPDVWHVVTGFPMVLRLMGSGLKRPKQPIPGSDMAGVVEAVGSAVTRFKPGDAVFGETHRTMQWVNGGTFAEYVCAPEDVLAHKPEELTFEQAATVPTAGMIAVNNLRPHLWDVPGQTVLVNGAAGGVGSIALQLAKAKGAIVTGVDHTTRQDLMRTLGADTVVDYTEEDITRRSERYDLIVDVASTLSLTACKRIFSPQGAYVIIGHDHYGTKGRRIFGSIPLMMGLMLRAPFDRHLPSPGFEGMDKQRDMQTLCELIKAGHLTPIVDRVFPLEEVPQALVYLQSCRAQGRIVVAPNSE